MGATQQFVYECSSSVGWFDDVSGNYDKSVHLKAHNDDIIGYSPDETRFEVEDSCHSGDKNGRVTIKFDTREVDILPIKDFRAFDFGDKQKRFGFSITEVSLASTLSSRRLYSPTLWEKCLRKKRWKQVIY